MRRSAWLLGLLALVACRSGGAGGVPPPPPPYAPPRPPVWWGSTCEVRCPDGSGARAFPAVRLAEGRLPATDGCGQIRYTDWRRACGNEAPGECVVCTPWERVAGPPGP